MQNKSNWTVISIANEIHELEKKLIKAKQDLHALPLHYFVIRALEACANDYGFTPRHQVDYLVDELNERDWPMDYYQLKEVFDGSGLEYEKEHIEKCRPDSREAIAEENARWADARDFGRFGGE